LPEPKPTAILQREAEGIDVADRYFNASVAKVNDFLSGVHQPGYGLQAKET
jgi:hypothetical protein